MTTLNSRPLEVAAWERSTLVVMARLRHVDGNLVTQATFQTIDVKVFDEESVTPDTPIFSDSLTISSVVFDTLQTDARWTRDSVGYNFRHQLAEQYMSGPTRHRIEYRFLDSGGQGGMLVVQASLKNVRSL